MGKLLKFEFRKITKQKSFYICFGIVFLLAVLNVVLTKSLSSESEEVIFSTGSMLVKSLSGSSFMMILGIFTALYVCDDYTNNTLKNIYAKGYTREKVYLSKYIMSVLVAVVMSLITMAITVALCSMNGATQDLQSSIIKSILSQIILVIAYQSLYFGVSMIFGHVGGSIAFNLVGPSLVVTILTLITSILKIDSLNISSFWLDSAFNSVTILNPSNEIITKGVIMGLIYIVIFCVGGLFLTKKKEI